MNDLMVIISFAIQFIFILIVVIKIFVSNYSSKIDPDPEISEEKITDEINGAIKGCDCSDNSDLKRAMKMANTAVSQFKQCWFFIWFTWLLLYSLLLVKYLFKINDNQYVDFFQNFFNNSSTFTLLIGYLILTELTVPDEQTRIKEPPNWTPWCILFFLLAYLEVIARLLNSDTFIVIFTCITAIIGGAVMALFIGSFDNEYLKPKFLNTTPIFSILYIYPVIQPMYIIFTKLNPIKDLELPVIITVLVGKILLYMLVSEQIKIRRLKYYFIKIRKLHYNIEKEWNLFCTEIHTE